MSSSHDIARSPRLLARRVACALFTVAVLASAAPAEAQPAKPPSSAAQDAAMAEARARFEEGIKQAEANDHEGARLKFNQAWALLKSPTVLYNLARAEQLSGHTIEALEHYRQFAKWPADPKVTDAQRQRANESVAELAKSVGQIEVEAPAGARISVDGRAIDPGNTDPIAVAPGKHGVEAIIDGKAQSVTLDVPAGAMKKARFSGGAQATAPAPQPSPAAPAEKSWGGEDTTTPANEEPSFWTTGRIAGVAIVGGGALALGAGGLFHVMAGTSEDEANKIRAGLPEPKDSACNDPLNNVSCAQLRTSVNNQSLREDLRTGMFIGGGVLVVGGAVLFLVSSPKSEPLRGSARIVPIATGREAGLAVVGRF